MRKNNLLLLAVGGLACLTALATFSSANRSSADAWMSQCVGGQKQIDCCQKPCTQWKETIVECVHFKTDKIPDCHDDGCIINVMDTFTCTAGGTGKDCKTKAAVPKKAAAYQTVYTGVTDCPFAKPKAWIDYINLIWGNCNIFGPVRFACMGPTEEYCKKGTIHPTIQNKPRLGIRQVCDN